MKEKESNKGGRPLKFHNEEIVMVNFRCTKKQRNELTKMAKELKITRSELILRAVNSKKIVANKEELFGEFVKINLELQRSGNNINQIAKQINTMIKIGSIQPTIQNVVKVLLESYNQRVIEVRAELKKIYKNLSEL